MRKSEIYCIARRTNVQMLLVGREMQYIPLFLIRNKMKSLIQVESLQIIATLRQLSTVSRWPFAFIPIPLVSGGVRLQ